MVTAQVPHPPLSQEERESKDFLPLLGEGGTKGRMRAEQLPQMVKSGVKLGFLVWLVVGGAVGGWGESVEAVFIPPRGYFETVKTEISKAKKSVSVCLYLFTLRPHQTQSDVFQLTQALINAHKRGLRVEVLLDQNINFSNGEDAGRDLSEGKNTPAYTYLKEAGVPVFYDDTTNTTHTKAVVIDEEIVILGSSNWTDAALHRNQEGDVMVRSKPFARRVIATLHAIPRQAPLLNHEDAGVHVPQTFLLDPDLLGRAVSSQDERALDCYLSLMRQSSTSFTMDYERMAKDLGIETMDRSAYRRQITKTLTKLQNKYHLISFETPYGQDAHVTMEPLEGDRFVKIPEGYWTLGWDQRLSFAGKCFFLISRHESETSTRRPHWSVAQKTLARRYGTSVWFLEQGLRELRQQNLMDVEYAPLPGATTQRRPIVYTPLTLHDPSLLDKTLQELIHKHGAEKVARPNGRWPSFTKTTISTAFSN